MYPTYRHPVFTVPVSAAPAPRVASPYPANGFRLHRIGKSFSENQKEFEQSRWGRLKEFCHLSWGDAAPRRSANVRKRVVAAHLVNSIVGCLPPTHLADDHGRIRCIGMENPGIVSSEENIIDPKR